MDTPDTRDATDKRIDLILGLLFGLLIAVVWTALSGILGHSFRARLLWFVFMAGVVAGVTIINVKLGPTFWNRFLDR